MIVNMIVLLEIKNISTRANTQNCDVNKTGVSRDKTRTVSLANMAYHKLGRRNWISLKIDNTTIEIEPSCSLVNV